MSTLTLASRARRTAGRRPDVVDDDAVGFGLGSGAVWQQEASAEPGAESSGVATGGSPFGASDVPGGRAAVRVLQGPSGGERLRSGSAPDFIGLGQSAPGGGMLFELIADASTSNHHCRILIPLADFQVPAEIRPRLGRKGMHPGAGSGSLAACRGSPGRIVP